MQARCCLIVCCWGGLWAPALRAQGVEPAPAVNAAALRAADDDGYVVHEWGTFTSYSGSDGVRLEFRPLVDDDLPDFVYDRARVSPQGIFTKRTIRARQRMETPVTYFYTDRLRQVQVQVGFPQGLLTEFYPPPVRMEPSDLLATNVRQIVPPEMLRNSVLDWGTVTLIPPSALRPNIDNVALADAIAARSFAALPPGGDPDPELYTGDHYYFARETDSALVHVRVPPSEIGLGPQGDFFEKFLFYRGVGNFGLPLTVTASAGESLQILNRGTLPLTGLVLIQVRDSEVRFRRLDDVAGRSRLDAAPPEPFVSTDETPAAALARTVQQVLQEQGLYEREAAAMVRTWEASWFGEEGTRLLYLLPPSLTEELLPLTLQPQPQSLVRVMVGRMEILSSDDERRLEQVVGESAAGRTAAFAALKEREAAGEAVDATTALPGVPESIVRLGRLAEPALNRIVYTTGDATVRGEALELIRLLQASEGAE